MYSKHPGLIYGFHGCVKSVALDVINQKKQLKESKNEYDWLGHGIYFWQGSYSRALDYATMLSNHPTRNKANPIKKPYVIGAVISLGKCLDLLDYQNLNFLSIGYEIFVESTLSSDMPKIKGVPGESKDLLRRNLDCAVFQTIHEAAELAEQEPFDSVRGIFFELKRIISQCWFQRDRPHSDLYP